MSRRAGLFGAEDDPQIQAVANALRARGVEVLLFDPQALEHELPISELDGALTWNGQPTEGLVGCYVCTLPSPLPAQAPPMLLEAFFVEFMRQRERATFVHAWLLQLEARGVRLVNPLQAGSALQYKPFQLEVLRRAGARVPRTLVSNDPRQVRAFAAALPQVIFKPLTGGAATRALDADALVHLEDLRASPCIFQERVDGDDVRVTLVKGEAISAVAIRTPAQALDYRSDPVYAAGQAHYEDVELPDEVLAHCRRASDECGLVLAGIDLKRGADGRFVFLELNGSPIYADLEARRGHRISEAIARALLGD